MKCISYNVLCNLFETFWLNIYCRKLAILYKLIINYFKIALDILIYVYIITCSVNKQF